MVMIGNTRELSTLNHGRKQEIIELTTKFKFLIMMRKTFRSHRIKFWI